MPNAIPGGNIVTGFGGFIQVKPMGGGNWIRVDVGRWLVQQIYRSTEVTHSGCMGAITRRRTGYDYLFRCELPYDRDPLDGGEVAEPTIGSGAPSLHFAIGDPYQYPPGMEKYYWSPSSLVDDAQTVCDSTGTEVVRLVITGHGNSLMFLCPDESGAANEYLAELQARGWM